MSQMTHVLFQFFPLYFLESIQTEQVNNLSALKFALEEITSLIYYSLCLPQRLSLKSIRIRLFSKDPYLIIFIDECSTKMNNKLYILMEIRDQ